MGSYQICYLGASCEEDQITKGFKFQKHEFVSLRNDALNKTNLDCFSQPLALASPPNEVFCNVACNTTVVRLS